jgi:hypothetical protein
LWHIFLDKNEKKTMRNSYIFFVLSVLCLVSIPSLISADCGTTPFDVPVSLVGYQCIGPVAVWSDPDTFLTVATCFWGYYSGSAYYNYANYNVILMNGTTVVNLATPTQCYEPSGITGNDEFYFVACSGGGVISIDKTSHAVATVASSTDCPTPYDVYAVGSTLYAACYGGSVISVNVLTNAVTVLADSTACSNPYAVYFRLGNAYAACYTGGPIGDGQIISISGSDVITVIDQGYCNQPTGVIATSSGVVYASCSDGSSGVIKIDGDTVTTIITPDICTYPMSISVDPNNRVFASCQWQDTMYIQDNAVAIAVPNSECNPSWTIVNPENGILYIACYATPDGVVAASPCG